LDFEVAMFIKICALSVLCLTVYALTSQVSPSLSFAVRLAGAVLIFSGIAVIFEDVISSLIALTSGEAALGEYVGVVLKATGIAILSHVSADICKDAGHASVGSAVILTAKLEIVLLSLPIIEKIIGFANEIMSVG